MNMILTLCKRLGFLKCGCLLVVSLVTYTSLNAATYTSTQDGDWDDPDTWICACIPGRTDNVIINHKVDINNVADNGSAGVKPQDINITPDICTPTSSDGCGNAGFYQTGNITINAGGEFNSNKWVMTTGMVSVNDGTFTVVDGGNNTDLYVLGRFDLLGTSSLTVSETLLLGNGAVLNIGPNSTSEIRDDVILDGDNVFLCGSGTLSIDDTNNTSEASNVVELVNSSDDLVLDQICDQLTITCTDDTDCCVENCADDFGAVGNDGEVSPGEGTADTPSILPVEYIYFRGSAKKEIVVIEWGTATEIDNDRFEIEKSVDGIIFSQIGTVAGNGDSNDLIQYSFTDGQPYAGINYYRLKQVDYDGDFEYSKIITVYSGEIQDFQFFPNPVNNRISIIPGDNFSRTQIKIKISDLAGRVFHQEVIDSEESVLTIPISLISGIYFLELRSNHFSQTERFVSQ